MDSRIRVNAILKRTITFISTTSISSVANLDLIAKSLVGQVGDRLHVVLLSQKNINICNDEGSWKHPYHCNRSENLN